MKSFLSSRVRQLNVGVLGYTDNSDVVDVIGNIKSSRTLISTIPTGTSPLSVESTTLVTNLNADLLDGQQGTYYLNIENATGNFSIGDIFYASTESSISKLPIGLEGNLLSVVDGIPSWETITVEDLGGISGIEIYDDDAAPVYVGKIDKLSFDFGLLAELDPLDNTKALIELDLSVITPEAIGAISGIGILDENILLGEVQNINFVGENITASVNGGTATITLNDNPTFETVSITAQEGTPPLSVQSRTLVTYLNADLLDGAEGSYYRNASNLNAGTVPLARLSGSYDINISGTAATATNANYINVTKDNSDTNYKIPFTDSIGGYQNIYIDNDLTDFTYNPNTGVLSSKQFSSSVADGAPPLIVSSTTLVDNLNADLLDGQEGSYYLDLDNATNVLVETKGGTGLDTYIKGDIIYASNTNTLDTLPIGSNNSVLYVQEVLGEKSIVWKSLTAGDVGAINGVDVEEDGSNIGKVSTLNFNTNIDVSIPNGGNTAIINLSQNPQITSLTTTNDSTINDVRIGKGGGSVVTNTLLGYQGLFSNTAGSNNTAVGYQSLYLNENGNYNTAVGVQSLFSNESSSNSAFGYNALYSNTVGISNTAIGRGALYSNISGSFNVYLGSYSGNTTTSNRRIIIGTGNSPNNLFDAPKTTDTQFAIGHDIDGTTNYWIVGNENYHIGFGVNDPQEKVDIDGNLKITGEIHGPANFVIDPATVGDNSGSVEINGTLQVNNELHGPANFVIDPSSIGDNTGTVIIKGNLQVDGETTTINSTIVTIQDKNIILADGSENPATSDGAGITIDGAGATITYNSTNDSWQFNKPLYSTITTGTSPLIISSTTLVDNLNADLLDGQEGSYYLNLDNATGVLDETKGGTGQTTYATGDILYSSATDTLSKLTIGSQSQILSVSASGIPEWIDSTVVEINILEEGTLVGSATSINFVGGAITATFDAPSSTATLTLSDTPTFSTITSNVATGTAPLVVTSTTLVSNLNADLLDGQEGTYYLDLANATGTLGETKGGTGQTTYATGDILYSSATDTLSRLSIGSNNQVLSISSGVPAWKSLVASDIGAITGIDIEEDSTNLGTKTIVSFGSGITASTDPSNSSRAIVSLSLSASDVGIDIKEEGGTSLGKATTLNFVGRATTATFDTPSSTATITLSDTPTFSTITSDVATGTAPLVITSTTLVSNLNADLLDGQEGSYYLNLDNATGVLDETKGGTGQTTYATGDILYSSATDTLSKLTIGSNDQVLTVDATGVPTWKSLTAGDVGAINGVDIEEDGSNIGKATTLNFNTNLDASIVGGTATIDLSDDPSVNTISITIASGTAPLTITSTTLVDNLNADLLDGQEGSYYLNLDNATGVLDETKGGTGQSTYTTGDILYASGTNTLAKLPIGGSNNVLIIENGVPVWGSLSAGDVGALSAVGIEDDGVSLGSATTINFNTNLDASVVGSTATIDLSDDPSVNTISITVANGTAPLTITSTTLVSNLNADLLDGQEGSYYLNLDNATGVLDETKGGTGISTYTTGDILYASGTNTLAKLPIGGSNNVLIIENGVPVWKILTAGDVGALSAVGIEDDGVSLGSATTINFNTNLDASVVGSTATIDLSDDVSINSITTTSDSYFNEVKVGKGNGNIATNTAVGYQTLENHVANGNNVALGYQSLYSNTTGTNNTANGYQALYSNTTGTDNTAIGYQALRYNTTGGNNTTIGISSGSNITTGSNNVCIGSGSQPSAADISNEVTIGNTSITTFRVPGIDYTLSRTNTTIATTTTTTIDTIDIGIYRSARITIQITQGTDYQTSDILLIHDGTTASFVEYGSIATNDYLGTFSATISGTDALLQITMGSATSASVKVLSSRTTL